MPDALDEKLRLRDGAEKLELPDEAAQILGDLRTAVNEGEAAVRIDGHKKLWVYNAPDLCNRLSSLASGKVRNQA